MVIGDGDDDDEIGCARMLLDRGADPNRPATCRERRSPVMLCVRYEVSSIMMMWHIKGLVS